MPFGLPIVQERDVLMSNHSSDASDVEKAAQQAKAAAEKAALDAKVAAQKAIAEKTSAETAKAAAETARAAAEQDAVKAITAAGQAAEAAKATAESKITAETRAAGTRTPEGRKELLLKMYDQMFNDINRHIMVVWQSVGVLIGAFAIFALVEKNIISPDLASALVILIASWLLANLLDSSYWYNRNLIIIANIERQFLNEQDIRDIHYYFGKHRKKGSMLTHLRVQFGLGVGVTLLVLVYHFFTQIYPVIDGSITKPQKGLPYLVLLVAAVLLLLLHSSRKAAYQEFLDNSPGISVKTGTARYGAGHPVKE